MKRPPFPYVRVTWLDAFSEDAWTVVDTYKVEDHEVETSGYLVKETPTYLLITPNLAWSVEEKLWEMCAAMAIPKGMVLGSVKTLKRAPTASAPLRSSRRPASVVTAKT